MKQAATGDALGEFTITALLKYDYPTQDKLAKVAILGINQPDLSHVRSLIPKLRTPGF